MAKNSSLYYRLPMKILPAKFISHSILSTHSLSPSLSPSLYLNNSLSLSPSLSQTHTRLVKLYPTIFWCFLFLTEFFCGQLGSLVNFAALTSAAKWLHSSSANAHPSNLLREKFLPHFQFLTIKNYRSFKKFTSSFQPGCTA